MKRKMMSFVIAGALACAAPLAFAQSSTGTQDTGMQHPQSGAITHQPPYKSEPASSSSTDASQSGTSSESNMSGTSMSGSNTSRSSMSSSSMGNAQMMGEHSMSGTVTSVSSDDMVSLKTGHGTLKLHFPNASQNLKSGDKITVHLSYSKDSG